MAKPTIKSIATLHGVDESTIRQYRDDGIDIYNEEEVAAYKESMLTPNSMEYAIDDLDSAKENFIAMKFKKLTHEASLKESESILKDLEVKKRKGELVPINEVCEVNLLVSSKVKAQLKALTLTLPPKLEGLSIKDMSKVIDESIRDVLEYLAAELNMVDE